MNFAHFFCMLILASTLSNTSYSISRSCFKESQNANPDDLRNGKIYPEQYKQLGVNYCSYVHNSIPHLTEPDITQHPKYKEDPEKFNQREQLYGKKIDQLYEAPVYVKYINDVVGYGVFADDDIEPGMIGIYAGTIRLMHEINHNCFCNGTFLPCANYVWGLVIIPNPENLTASNWSAIDGYSSGNFTRFINHNNNPNIKAMLVAHNNIWYMIYFTDKPIKKDEQLLIDYGPVYWKVRNIEPQTLD